MEQAEVVFAGRRAGFIWRRFGRRLRGLCRSWRELGGSVRLGMRDVPEKISAAQMGTGRRAPPDAANGPALLAIPGPRADLAGPGRQRAGVSACRRRAAGHGNLASYRSVPPPVWNALRAARQSRRCGPRISRTLGGKATFGKRRLEVRKIKRPGTHVSHVTCPRRPLLSKRQYRAGT
jgi:hypothetical protein